MSRTGKVTVGRVTCAGPHPCKVHTALTGSGGAHHKALVAARKKPRKVTYARATSNVPAGKTVPIKLKLTKKGLKALEKAGKLKVTVTIVITSPGDQNVTRRFKLILKAAKAKHRRK